MSKFCISCGAPLEDGAKFCGSCGAQTAPDPAPAQQPPISPADAQPEQPVPQPTSEPAFSAVPYPEYAAAAQPAVADTAEPKKKSKKGLIIGLSVGAVVLAAAILVFIFVFLPMITGGEKGKAQQSPEDMISFYETEINKLIKDGTPLSKELLDTTFEKSFIKSEYESLLDLSLSQVNEQLAGIFDSDFKKRYGDDATESLEVKDYETIDAKDVITDEMSLFMDLPEVEEARRYHINAFINHDGEKTHWTDLNWDFVKVKGKWYLMITGSQLI